MSVSLTHEGNMFWIHAHALHVIGYENLNASSIAHFRIVEDA